MATPLSKVVTGRCRFSYVHVFEPWTNDPEKDPKYGLTLLIPKSDKATMAKLRKAEGEAKAAGIAKFGDSWAKKGLKSIIHDGDEEADLETNPEYEGHWYLAVGASKDYPPTVVDKAVQPILDSTEVYSGCYGRVSLNPFPYNAQGNRGVSFGLRNVQKLADGESMGGGRSNPEDDFDSVDDEDDDDLI